jgi:hypothetical protein
MFVESINFIIQQLEALTQLYAIVWKVIILQVLLVVVAIFPVKHVHHQDQQHVYHVLQDGILH